MTTSAGFDRQNRTATYLLALAFLAGCGGGGGGGTPIAVSALEIFPLLEFVASGPEGGPFGAETTYTVKNPGAGGLNWSVDVDVSWITLSKTSGILAAGGEEQVTVSVKDAAANGLPAGQHKGIISFIDTDLGSVAFTTPAVLSVDFGTRIDNNAWLSIDGVRFFPIGVWNQLPRATEIAHMRSLGINTYLTSGEQHPEPNHPQMLDLLGQNDMWGVLIFNMDVMDHPRLLGWIMPDEPDQRATPPSAVQSQYDAIKAIDPRHFVALNLTSRFYRDANFSPSGMLSEADYKAYTDATDIVSFDMYPVTGWNQPTWVYTPGAMTADMLDRFVNHMKPVWAIVEASRQRLSYTPMSTPGPTPQQMRFQIWDSIINGATAIHYFVSSFHPFEFANLTPEIEQEMTRVNGQIQALSSVILSPPPSISVTSAEAGGMDHNLMLRQDGSTFYLFANNADMGYNAASINFTFDRNIVSVTVYDEGRMIIPNGKSFMDSFDALEVHIYEVRF